MFKGNRSKAWNNLLRTARARAAQVMHTILEDLRWCGPQAFAPVGKLSQTVLTRLLNAAEFPFEKKIPPEIAKKLEKRFEDWGIKKKSKKEH